ncbi:MAG TPA: hypothetical protein VJM75_02230, partial [Acidimicrobiales bacterium]|nr:hypothetical protein [Acidimicrobiales bacterium]
HDGWTVQVAAMDRLRVATVRLEAPEVADAPWTGAAETGTAETVGDATVRDATVRDATVRDATLAEGS